MADHDQRLKVTLRELLAEFAALTVPGWVGRFDFAAAQWLQQQLFPDPPRGERREIDLVARVPTKPAGEMLFHVEVESGESVADIRERMPRYHDYLGYQHGLPVLSLALYLGVALEGAGWDAAREDLWGENLGLTRWPYLGLPGLDALVYVEGDNLLGVAFSVLMRVAPEKRPWLKARALQRIAEAELTVYKRFLLMDFVEAYLPLDGPHLDEYQRLLVTKEFGMALKIGKTSFEEGMEKGERTVVGLMLEARFGSLDVTVEKRLDALSSAQLRDLARRLLKAGSLAELGLEDAP